MESRSLGPRAAALLALVGVSASLAKPEFQYVVLPEKEPVIRDLEARRLRRQRARAASRSTRKGRRA